ncbi:metallophosphoesterase [Hyphomicrobium sp. B1]|uniref:metallophosphoesterase n=1 Tax=Hyphomicrobium sp. B1 TaxID=3075651 RepID=UPI003C2EA83B
MISRRDLLKMTGVAGVGSTALSGYAVAEAFREHVTTYAFTPPNWTPGLTLRLAILADLHVCDPWMSTERLERIVAQTNALNPDAILMLGDFVVGLQLGSYSGAVSNEAWAAELAKLKAPYGVHAILGNHDWWQSAEVQKRRAGPTPAGLALKAVGIPVYENTAIRLEKDGHPFWIAGLGDQWAFKPPKVESDEVVPSRDSGLSYAGVDDLPATMRAIEDDAPVILMVHEPDIFPSVSKRVSLTFAGHTHGGQVRILGYAPVVPSIYGSRYVYGHIVEDGRHLIVSGGLGCSSLPIRIGSPPEIVVADLGGANGGEV